MKHIERGSDGFGSTDKKDYVNGQITDSVTANQPKNLIPEAVKSALTELYNKQHAGEVVPKSKYPSRYGWSGP